MAELELEKRIKAPVAEVFDAFVQPGLIGLWLGPSGARITDVVSEPRVEGKYGFRMTNAAGGRFAVEGKYLEIEPNHRLVLSWTWTEFPAGDGKTHDETRLECKFEPDGDDTIIRVRHSGLPTDAVAQNHGRGWRQGLEKLAGLLEGNR